MVVVNVSSNIKNELAR
uniref:Uncharacterized protein n=1 Tax=Anguilla anguilla TaxID=7936 RepID=A0A0E9Q9G8_ANGAN